MSYRDGGQMTERAQVGVGLGVQDGWGWHTKIKVEKYWGPYCGQAPYEVVEREGNIAMNGGVDVIWKRLITRNPSTSSTGALLQAYSTKAAICVGASSASSGTRTFTDLVSTSKARRVMDAGYPTHTTGTSTSARVATFKATFSTAQANFAWKEWGIANTTVSAGGRLLQRKAQLLGTKTSAATWAMTVTLTIS